MEQRTKDGYDLRRLPIWSLYIDGARDILLRLQEDGVKLVDDTHVPKNERTVYNRAVWHYLLSDKNNIDKYLLRSGEGRFYEHERNSKGELTSCKFGLFKPTTNYELI